MVRINRNFLEQFNFDSGVPGGLSMVVHTFDEPGEYEISLLRDDQVTDRLPLVVIGDTGDKETYERMQAAVKGVEPPSQVTIELGQARRALLEPPVGELEEPFLVKAGGYAAFTGERREDTAAILVRRRDASTKEDAFDSRRLTDRDTFAVTLVRPGLYSLKNALTGAEGRIRVAYPVVGKERYRPPAPVTVEVTGEGFSPGAIDLQPAQGIVFRIGAPSRIRIDLVEPDDGPEGPRPPKTAGWRKPQAES